MLWKRLGHLLLARRVPQNQDVRVSSAFPQRSPTELPQPKIAFNERKAYRLRVEISTFEYNRCTSNLAAGLKGATVELQIATTKNAEVPISAANSSKVLASCHPGDPVVGGGETMIRVGSRCDEGQ